MLGISQHFAKKIFGALPRLFGVRPKWDNETLESVEERMIAADIGVDLVMAVLDDVKKKKPAKDEGTWDDMRKIILEGLARRARESVAGKEIRALPRITLLFGVNGGGKTTSAAKLAWRLLQEKRKSVLVAADTFRAAAREQLAVWGGKLGIDVWLEVDAKDPASVIYNALLSRQGQDDISFIIDTAGRLQNKTHLMEELKKIRRVIAKVAPNDHVLSLLVVDATTGQNGLVQAREFHDAINIDGLILTKYDSTAKGGIALSVMTELKKPVYFLGIGEKPEDLWPFNLDEFLNEIF